MMHICYMMLFIFWIPHSGALPFIPFINRGEFSAGTSLVVFLVFFLWCPCDPETSWLIVFGWCCFSLTFVCIPLFSLNEMTRDVSLILMFSNYGVLT